MTSKYLLKFFNCFLYVMLVGSVMELHIDLLQLLMRIDLVLSGVDNLQIAFWMCCNSIVTPLFKQTS